MFVTRLGLKEMKSRVFCISANYPYYELIYSILCIVNRFNHFQLFSFVVENHAKITPKTLQVWKKVVSLQRNSISKLWQQYHYHYPRKRTRQRGNLKSLSVSWLAAESTKEARVTFSSTPNIGTPKSSV